MVLWKGTLFALVVALVTRPLGAALATTFAPYSARERLLLGWAGPRGAVPVVLATFPVIERVPRSVEFFNIAFFVVLVSTLVQGMTVEPLARGAGPDRRAGGDLLSGGLSMGGTVRRRRLGPRVRPSGALARQSETSRKGRQLIKFGPRPAIPRLGHWNDAVQPSRRPLTKVAGSREFLGTLDGG